MRERVRFNKIHTGLAAVAALFVFGTEPASAQEARPYIEDLGFREYQFPNEATQPLEIPLSNSFTTSTNAPRLNLGEAPRARNEGEETGEDEIVVTALRTENFGSTENSEFDDNIFDRMGIQPTMNPNLEGLAFLTPEEMRDNGWAVTVPVFGSRRGETGPFLSVGAGRPERIIAGGVRF